MEPAKWESCRVWTDIQNLWYEVNLAEIRNKDQVGLNEIKRIFEEYLDEAYIGDNDIADYINEFDKDQDGMLFYQ